MQNAPQEEAHSDEGHLRTEESVIQQVRSALRDIEFGSVLIKIHQGQVVALEISTKVRLDT